MVKHTQTIRWLLPTNFLSLFDHFVGLALKGLIYRVHVLCHRYISDYIPDSEGLLLAKANQLASAIKKETKKVKELQKTLKEEQYTLSKLQHEHTKVGLLTFPDFCTSSDRLLFKKHN